MLWLTAAFAADDAEVREHLLEVAAALRAETPDTLPEALRRERLATLDALESYAWAGDFPQNDGGEAPARVRLPPRTFEAHTPGRHAPRFIDDEGTHCAVGYLMALDAPGLAARVDAEHSRDWLPEIDTPGVAGWAAAHGLTLDELAWIQPGYVEAVETVYDVPACPETIAVGNVQGLCELEYAPLRLCSDTCGQMRGFMELSTWTDEPQSFTFLVHGRNTTQEFPLTVVPGESVTVEVIGPADDFPGLVEVVMDDPQPGEWERDDDPSMSYDPTQIRVFRTETCEDESGCSAVERPFALGVLAAIARRPR